VRRPQPPLRKIEWGRLLGKLERFYGKGSWRTPVMRERGVDPYRVLVSTILSHRTRDEVTARAAHRLLVAYPTPTALSRSSVSKIRSLIREVGLADSKAAALHECASIIVRSHGGKLPQTERDLLSLPLVGKKTASAILVFGFRMGAIPVDTHIHRVVNRLGVVRTRSLDETADALEEVVPWRYWGKINPVLVQHGQNMCTAVHPMCDSCPIFAECSRVGVD
jgi:endonuclease III